MFKNPIHITLLILASLVVLYCLSALRYFFKFSHDSTMYIEDRHENLRNDQKLTLYQNSKHSENISFHKYTHENIHRSLYSRLFFYDEIKEKTTKFIVFAPPQSYNFISLSQKSDKERNETSETHETKASLYDTLKTEFLHYTQNTYPPKIFYDNFKKLQFYEIDLKGQEYLYVPKGYFVFTEVVQNLKQSSYAIL